MATQTIDRVQVEIEATAKGTSAVFKQLESQLTSLKNVLSAIDTSKLTQAANASKAITVNTSGMSKAEKDISNSVNKIKESLAGLNSYKNAALSGDSSSLTSFNRRVISIQSAIDTLGQKLKNLGDTRVPTESFSELETKIDEAKAKVESLKAEEEKYWTTHSFADNTYTDLQINIANAEGELDNLIDKQQTMLQDGSAYTDPFQGYRDGLAEVQNELSGVSNSVSLAANTMNDTPIEPNTGDTTTRLDEIKAKAEQVASSFVKMAGTGIVNGFKSLKSNLSKIRSTLSNIGDTASNKVSKGFSTILKYGFGIRSLYVLFRRLKTAIKDSFTELQNSGAYYETTKANIDALKSSLTTLKYQFGAAFEPIFNSVAPALQTLINYLITAMNTLSAFIAKITGKSTYSKAVAATGDIASNTGSAADSAKEMNKQLQGFDELNNLSSSSGGSGGSGGGSSGSSSGVTYETASVDSALSSFWSSLADDIKNGDWKKVGTTISTKLSEAMESIPWDTIYSKAKNFGTNLANFLNGLITPRLFGNLGTTLANAINTAFTFLNSFGTTFDWSNFGTSIGTGITNFFKNADFGLWGDTVHTWVAGILTAGIALLKSTDFKEIGTKLAAFLNGLQIGDIAAKLAVFALNLVSGIAQAITSLWSNSDVSTKIGLAIAGLFAAAKLTGLSTKLATAVGQYLISNPILIGKAAIAVATFTVTFKAAKFVFGNIAEQFDSELASYYKDFTWTDFVETVLSPDGSGVDWTAIKNAWVDMCSDYFEPLFQEFDSWAKIGAEIIAGIQEGIKNKLDTIKTWVSNTFKKLVDAVKDFFGIKSPSTVFKEIGGYMIDGLKEGLKNGVTKIKNWIKTNVTDKIKGFFNGIKTITISIAGAVLDSFTKAKENWESIKSKAETLTAEAKEKVRGALQTLKDNWSKGWETTKKLWTEAKESAGNLISTLKDKWEKWTPKVKELLTEAKEKVESGIKGSINWLQTQWDNWRNKDDKKELKAEASDNGTIASTEKTWTTWVNKNDPKTLSIKKASDWSTVESAWTSIKSNDNVVKKLKLEKAKSSNAGFQGLYDIWTQKLVDGSANKTLTLTDKNGALSSAAKAWETLSSGTKSTELTATFQDSFTNDLKNAWNKMVREIKNALKNTSTSSSLKEIATGGAYYGGSWHSIPQYANGTLDALNRGSVFVAGEAGPEVVGHINGRTEVLNRSQLASTIFTSITNGMRQFKGAQMVQPPQLALAGGGYVAANGYGVHNDNSAELLVQQNELIAEQNRLLSIIAQKDVSINSRDVFNAVRSESNNYYNRTGNSPFFN